MTTIVQHSGEKIVNFCGHIQFVAGQKCLDLVDLKTLLQHEYLNAKLGFDAAEKESSRV